MGKGADSIRKLATKERKRLRAQVSAFKKEGTSAVDIARLRSDLERMVAFDDQQKAEMDAFKCEQWLASLNDFLQRGSCSDIYFEMEAEEGSDEDSDAFEYGEDAADEIREEMLALQENCSESTLNASAKIASTMTYAGNVAHTVPAAVLPECASSSSSGSMPSTADTTTNTTTDTSTKRKMKLRSKP